MDHQSAASISKVIYARVVKSCSRADSTASAFSQVQEATAYVRMSRHFASSFETYQKDGYRRNKSHPGRACSRRQLAHRCTDQRGESLKIILVSKTFDKHLDNQEEIQLTARAAGARDLVLRGSLIASAVEGRLLTAGALGLGSADTACTLGSLAASRSDHFHGVGW